MDVGGAFVILQGACDGETPALGDLVIVDQHDVVSQSDLVRRNISGD